MHDLRTLHQDDFAQYFFIILQLLCIFPIILFPTAQAPSNAVKKISFFNNSKNLTPLIGMKTTDPQVRNSSVNRWTSKKMPSWRCSIDGILKTETIETILVIDFTFKYTLPSASLSLNKLKYNGASAYKFLEKICARYLRAPESRLLLFWVLTSALRQGVEREGQ